MQAAPPPGWPCRSAGRCQHAMTHPLPSLAKGPRLQPSVWCRWLLRLGRLRCGAVGGGCSWAGRNSLGDGGCWGWMIPCRNPAGRETCCPVSISAWPGAQALPVPMGCRAGTWGSCPLSLWRGQPRFLNTH